MIDLNDFRCCKTVEFCEYRNNCVTSLVNEIIADKARIAELEDQLKKSKEESRLLLAGSVLP